MYYVAEADDDYNFCNYCDHSFLGKEGTVWCSCDCPNFFEPLCKVCQDCEFKIQCERECFYERQKG